MNKLDDFEMLLKKKAEEDVCFVSDDLNMRINNTLASLPDNRRYKRPITKVVLIAALVAVISGTTALASTNPTVKNVVGGIISYFDYKKDTKYMGDKSSFIKFNEAVGVSAKDKDIKLTVNNIATDDNFINIFYTIESKEPINMFPDEQVGKDFKALFSAPFLDVKINGKVPQIANNNDIDAYFEGDKVLKVMERFNVSQIDLPKIVDVEISTNEIFRTKGKWEIATSINKSDIEIVTKTVKPNINKVIDLGDYKHNITIEKASVSPFGNQIVIREKTSNDNMFDTFAIFDDKGNNLDVLSTDMIGSISGKATNSFEFIKANEDINYITLVPIKFTKIKNADTAMSSISKLPITFKTDNIGSRVVDKIDFDKNVMRIKYHNDGVEMWEPTFLFFDNNGNKAKLGQCTLTSKVDRKTGEFTQIFTFEDENVDFSKIAKIGTFIGGDKFDLLKDQAIKINLK